MPRAKIPYGELALKVTQMYPEPIYRGHFIVTSEFNQGMTPTRVYDRSTGNYAPIGWMVVLDVSRFQGEYDQNLQPIYREERFKTVVLLEN